MAKHITEEALKDSLTRQGWKVDTWGNLKKDVGEKLYRICFKPRVVRLEKQVTFAATEFSEARKEWVRIESEGYKDCLVTEDGQVAIGKLKLKAH